MFSVVGGKLSEGINFSDDMGRCIVVVGLPFPNPSDPELTMRMNFIENKYQGGGRRFYDGICMRAVNQAIGRSIRHINDYSIVLLLDERYGLRVRRVRERQFMSSLALPLPPTLLDYRGFIGII